MRKFKVINARAKSEIGKVLTLDAKAIEKGLSTRAGDSYTYSIVWNAINPLRGREYSSMTVSQHEGNGNEWSIEFTDHSGKRASGTWYIVEEIIAEPELTEGEKLEKFHADTVRLFEESIANLPTRRKRINSLNRDLANAVEYLERVNKALELGKRMEGVMVFEADRRGAEVDIRVIKHILTKVMAEPCPSANTKDEPVGVSAERVLEAYNEVMHGVEDTVLYTEATSVLVLGRHVNVRLMKESEQVLRLCIKDKAREGAPRVMDVPISTQNLSIRGALHLISTYTNRAKHLVTNNIK